MPMHVNTPLLRNVRRRFGRLLETTSKTARRCVIYPLAWMNRRLRDGVIVVGITGSAGKTTTKDLCAAILSEFGPCESTPKSENERFNVAQTVFSLRGHHRFCVVELSAARPGQLDLPLRLTKPRIAVMTLVARDHYSAFKSVEAIAQEKGKVVSALPSDGVAVLNIDDPLVRAIGETCNRQVIWIGEGEGATLRLRAARSRWPEPLTLSIEHEGSLYEVQTPLHGTQLALSVLAALGVALALKLPLSRAMEALKRAEVAEGRMQIVGGADGVVFVRDDWKAPLWSLPAPLDFMKQATAGRKVLIIGTLSDYSLSASKVYPKVARQALDIGDLVLFVGPHAMRAMKAAERGDGALRAFPEIREAAAYLRTELRAGDLVLLKGSNKADHLVRLILDRYEPIRCWQDRCGLSAFCGACGQLYQVPAGDDGHATGTRSEVRMAPPQAPGIAASGAGADAPRVIVGLGNPGQQFRNTPHNVGYRVLEILADSAGAAWEAHSEGLVAFATLGGVPVALLKPGVSVNLSGEVVRRFVDRLGIDVGRCTIIHDDMDLALGDVRLKREGGDAGHKGVRSVIAELGSGGFERIRVGVRRSGEVRRARELVLASFSAGEEAVVGDALERAASIVRERTRDGDMAGGARRDRATSPFPFGRPGATEM